MHRRHRTSLAVSAGLLTASVALAAPGQAEPADDAFLDALTSTGMAPVDPAQAVALGQSVCPMLAEPGQTTADAAAKVADAAGMPLPGATMFTGLAISMFCPAVVSSIGTANAPIPLPIPGF